MAVPWCAAASLDYAVSANLPGGVPTFATDREGNILIAERMGSYTCPLPTLNALNTCGSIWIAKLDASGRKLVFATYLGQGYADAAVIGADAEGNIVVAADTQSGDLPTVNALQPAKHGQSNFYVAKLSADGTQLIYATYLGGSGNDIVRSLVVDDAGAAYVLGASSSKDFPTTPRSLPKGDGGPNASALVAVKLSPDGQSLVYASFLPTSQTGVPVLDSGGSLVIWAHPLGSGTNEIWTLAPDGSALNRIPALPTSVGTWNESAFPRTSAGGFVLTGSVSGYLPLPGAPSPYTRIENGQAVNVPVPASRVSGFGVDPQNRSRVYAATDTGLLLSEDNGVTWNVVRRGACTAIAVDPFDSTRLYLGADRTYLSTDSGQTWNMVSKSSATSFIADPNTPGLVYSANGSVSSSSDGGATWTVVWSNPYPFMMPSFSYAMALGVHADPTHPGQAYMFGYTSCNMCAVNQYWIYRSTDQGVTWNPVPNGFRMLLPPYNNGAVGGDGDVDPATGDVYAVYHGQLVAFRGGDFSHPGVAIDLPPVYSFLFDPARPGRIYVELSDFSVMASDDQGATWASVAQLVSGSLGASGTGDVLHINDSSLSAHAYVFVMGPDGAIEPGDYLGGHSTSVISSGQSPGRVYIAGSTAGGLATMSAFQGTYGGGASDGFVASFDEDGGILWSTYLGGSGSDSISQVLPLPDGSVVVVGTTSSRDFPMLQPSELGAGSTFIAHIVP